MRCYQQKLIETSVLLIIVKEISCIAIYLCTKIITKNQ